MFRQFFKRHKTPIMRDILLEIFWTCGFQFKHSSSVRPKKLNSDTRSIDVEFIFRSSDKLSTLRWG